MIDILLLIFGLGAIVFLWAVIILDILSSDD